MTMFNWKKDTVGDCKKDDIIHLPIEIDSVLLNNINEFWRYTWTLNDHGFGYGGHTKFPEKYPCMVKTVCKANVLKDNTNSGTFIHVFTYL
jgi:hypothetical protein